MRAIEINENAILFDSKLNKDSQYKCPRSYQHDFSTGNNLVSLKFKDIDDANKFKKSIESKIIELKLKWKVISKFAEKPQKFTGQPSSQNIDESTSNRNLTLTSDASRIIRRSLSLYEGGEIEKQIFVENFLNIHSDDGNSLEMENSKKIGRDEQRNLRSGSNTTKENKWTTLRKRITLSVKKEYNTLPSSPTNLKHLSHVGWIQNQFGQPINHTGLSVANEESHKYNGKHDMEVSPPIGILRSKSLREDTRYTNASNFDILIENNISSPDDSEYHKISNFFKSEECLNESIIIQNKRDTTECDMPDASIDNTSTFDENAESDSYQRNRSRSGSQLSKVDLDWESTLGNLKKSIASISGPRLKPSNETSLDIDPDGKIATSLE